MFCHNCGVKLPDDMNYCPECGVKIAEGMVQAESSLQEGQEKANKMANSMTNTNIGEKTSLFSTIKTVCSLGACIFVTILVIGALSGKFDDLAYRLGLSGKPNSRKGVVLSDSSSKPVISEEDIEDQSKEQENMETKLNDAADARIVSGSKDEDDPRQEISDRTTADESAKSLTEEELNDLMDTIMVYYVHKYGTNNVDAEVDKVTQDTVIIRLYDPYAANVTSNNLGFYNYDIKTGMWSDGVTGEELDFSDLEAPYN